MGPSHFFLRFIIFDYCERSYVLTAPGMGQYYTYKLRYSLLPQPQWNLTTQSRTAYGKLDILTTGNSSRKTNDEWV